MVSHLWNKSKTFLHEVFSVSVDLHYSYIYTFPPALGMVYLFQKFALMKFSFHSQLVNSA